MGATAPLSAERAQRIGYDATVLRQAPHAGTARYARELMHAMRASAPSGARLVVLDGWPRWRIDAAWARPARRAVNLMADAGWLSGGALWAAASNRLDGWFGPANALPLLLPRPAVVTVHDLNFLTVPDAYDRGYARYAETMLRQTVRRARRIITDSNASRAELVARLGADPARVRAIYPGTDHLARVSPAAEDPGVPRPYALFVGQTEPHKNVGLLLDAWRAGVPDGLHLVVCGPAGRDDERLRTAAAGARLAGRVYFTGLVDDRRLARLYADARLFLFPSLAEGFGFPPLEAMARGVPTAVAAATSLPEVARDGALHFDSRDARALASLVTQMSEDRTLRDALSARGRRIAAGYTWAATARAVWEEVRNAVAE
jgi:glycosyltransferase involved in cell wall biosynthesis